MRFEYVHFPVLTHIYPYSLDDALLAFGDDKFFIQIVLQALSLKSEIVKPSNMSTMIHAFAKCTIVSLFPAGCILGKTHTRGVSTVVKLAPFTRNSEHS